MILLGGGASGSAYKFNGRDTSCLVVKIPNSEDYKGSIRRELDIAKNLRGHPCIVFGRPARMCDSEQTPCMVTRFAGWPLDVLFSVDYKTPIVLHKDKETMALCIRNMRDALDFLRFNCIVHNDLRLPNVLFNGDRDCKTECFRLIDFDQAETSSNVLDDLYGIQYVFTCLWNYVHPKACPTIDKSKIEQAWEYVFDFFESSNKSA